MRVIAVANQKGGCGKTTTAINLSFSLASKGKQVLLIDFDPQAHATMGLDINPPDLDQCIYEVLKPSEDYPPGIDDIVLPIRDNLDLAPSKATLSALEQELMGVEGRESRLLRAIDALNKPYDIVLIDCPPSIGHLCFNALRACREVIIPIDLSLFSLRGVSKLTEIVILFKEKMGHEINARALITMYDFRTRYSRRVLEKVREKFGDNVFDAAIRYNIRLRETVDYGLPIGEYDRHSIGHKDYEKLAEELMTSWVQGTVAHGGDALDAARNLLEVSEEYTTSEASAPGDEESPVAEATQPPYA